MGMCLYVERRADIDDVMAGGPVETDVGEVCDLHKAWHILHFVLAGDAWGGEVPEGFLMAGETVDAVDCGYGPGHAHDAATTREIAAFLRETPWEALVARWDQDAMEGADVYCTSSEEEDQEFAEGYYNDLRAFVAQAAEAGEGLLLYMS